MSTIVPTKKRENRFIKLVQGITATFLFKLTVFVVLAFVIGVVYGKLLNVAPDLSNFLHWLRQFGTRFVVLYVLGWLLVRFTARNLFHVRAQRLFEQMHDSVALQENLAPVAVTAGIFVIAMQIVSLHAPTQELWIFEMLTKGVIGLYAGVLATIPFAFLSGIKSFSDFNQLFDLPDNNQLVILIMVFVNITVHLALTS